MARTRKQFPWEWNSCFRTPRGKRKAIAGKARKGAVPPDAWDDINYDKQCWLPMKVAAKLVRKGMNPYDVISHLVHRYGLTQKTAREVVELEIIGRWRWWPEGTVLVYKEQEDK